MVAGITVVLQEETKSNHASFSCFSFLVWCVCKAHVMLNQYSRIMSRYYSLVNLTNASKTDKTGPLYREPYATKTTLELLGWRTDDV